MYIPSPSSGVGDEEGDVGDVEGDVGDVEGEVGDVDGDVVGFVGVVGVSMRVCVHVYVCVCVCVCVVAVYIIEEFLCAYSHVLIGQRIWQCTSPDLSSQSKSVWCKYCPFWVAVVSTKTKHFDNSLTRLTSHTA